MIGVYNESALGRAVPFRDHRIERLALWAEKCLFLYVFASLSTLTKCIPFKPSYWKLYKLLLGPQERQYHTVLIVHTATNHVTMFCVQ
jgi:hypothetical protein